MWPLLALGVLAGAAATAALLPRRGAAPRGALPLSLSLCLVVRDEVERIEGLMADLVALAEGLGSAVADVVVVDEASADGTAALLERLQLRYPAIKTVRWPADTSGRGDALEAACALCAGRWILLRLARAGQAEAAVGVRPD